MREYGLVANGQLLRTVFSDKSPPGDWRPFKDATTPKHDPETEDLAEVAPLIDADGITRRWQVLDLAERRLNAAVNFSEPVKNDASYIPTMIPMWAFRRALRRRKMLDGILTFIKSLPDQQRLDAMEHLEYGNYIERYHPMIVGSAQQLGIPESTVDDIFRDGGKEK